MRQVWKVLSLVGIGCLAALGCQETPKRATIRPPKEEFHKPEEGAFSNPMKYPDEVLNNVTPRRKKDDDKFGAPAGFNGGPGGGGMPGPGMNPPAR